MWLQGREAQKPRMCEISPSGAPWRQGQRSVSNHFPEGGRALHTPPLLPVGLPLGVPTLGRGQAETGVERSVGRART